MPIRGSGCRRTVYAQVPSSQQLQAMALASGGESIGLAVVP